MEETGTGEEKTGSDGMGFQSGNPRLTGVLAKVEWGYKPTTFVLCSADTKPGTFAVVPSADLGIECVRLSAIRAIKPEEKIPSTVSVVPWITRVATAADLLAKKRNEEIAQQLTVFTQKQSELGKLGMRVVESVVALDRKKALIMYTAESRVDFRTLLKTLAAEFHMRLELRQIGARDKARLVGGLGVCGLPLCCKTFITVFEGITIAMAKNQLLSLNIPKLSGQCGKLMCCLSYENSQYAQLRPLYPRIGETAVINGKRLRVANVNLLSDTITVSDGDTYEAYSSAVWRTKMGGRIVPSDGESAGKWNCQGAQANTSGGKDRRGSARAKRGTTKG